MYEVIDSLTIRKVPEEEPPPAEAAQAPQAPIPDSIMKAELNDWRAQQKEAQA